MPLQFHPTSSPDKSQHIPHFNKWAMPVCRVCTYLYLGSQCFNSEHSFLAFRSCFSEEPWRQTNFRSCFWKWSCFSSLKSLQGIFCSRTSCLSLWLGTPVKNWSSHKNLGNIITDIKKRKLVLSSQNTLGYALIITPNSQCFKKIISSSCFSFFNLFLVGG